LLARLSPKRRYPSSRRCAARIVAALEVMARLLLTPLRGAHRRRASLFPMLTSGDALGTIHE